MSDTPGPQEPAATAQRLNDALTRLRARLRTESGQHETGLSPTQLGILATVVREGPVTAAGLAAMEHVSAQAIAQSLAALRSAGLLRSEPDPHDGRKKLISAAPSATALVDRLLAGRAAYLTRAIEAVLAPGEQGEVVRAIALLERLADADLGETRR
jgi:DNA-binding MarR family transcriptional regulator